MVACDGGVSGTCAYARVKTADCFAKASRFGVSPRGEPRNPMRSARVVSSVIRMMLGSFGLGPLVCGAAHALAVRAAANNKQRITAILIRNPLLTSTLWRFQSGWGLALKGRGFSRASRNRK